MGCLFVAATAELAPPANYPDYAIPGVHSWMRPVWGLLSSDAQVIEDAPEASGGVPLVLAVRAVPQNPTPC